MYIGDIQTSQDAIEYAEGLYRDARRENLSALYAMEDAVNAFLDGRKDADEKTLKRLKRKVRLASRAYQNAKEREDFTRAYLQGIHDIADALF